MTFQLCQIISYLSSWPHFWIGVINSRAGKCPPPLPLSQLGGKGETEARLVSPCGHPWEAPPRSWEGQSRTLPLQPLPLWRVGNVQFWEGSGGWRHRSHPFASWVQSRSSGPSLTADPSAQLTVLFFCHLVPPCFLHAFLADQTLTLLSALCLLFTGLLRSPPPGLLSFLFFLPVFTLFPRTLTMYVSSGAVATAGLGGMRWDGMWWECWFDSDSRRGVLCPWGKKGALRDHTGLICISFSLCLSLSRLSFSLIHFYCLAHPPRPFSFRPLSIRNSPTPFPGAASITRWLGQELGGKGRALAGAAPALG